MFCPLCVCQPCSLQEEDEYVKKHGRPPPTEGDGQVGEEDEEDDNDVIDAAR